MARTDKGETQWTLHLLRSGRCREYKHQGLVEVQVSRNDRLELFDSRSFRRPHAHQTNSQLDASLLASAVDGVDEVHALLARADAAGDAPSARAKRHHVGTRCRMLGALGSAQFQH
jgi:hypothetical protein